MAFLRRQNRRRAIVAAARKIDVTDKKTLEKLRKRREAWQGEAWSYYDEIGEIKYALNLKADAISQVRWFIGVQESPNEEPVPLAELGDRERPAGADVAEDSLERLRQAEGGLGGLMREFSVNLDVPGEAWLLGRTGSDGEETWDVKSTDELDVQGSQVRVIGDEGKPGEPLGDDDVFIRVWRRHPRISSAADSNMRAILGECEELLILSRMIRAQAKSRLGAGLLYVPTEMSFGTADPTQDPSDGEDEDDPFANDLMESMTEPIHDEGAASAVVPLVIRGPADLADSIRLISLERQIDSEALEVRKELLRRIGNGLNLPVEKMLGIEQLNHWSAWLVDENFGTSVKPDLLTIASGLTTEFIWDSLDTAGVDREQARRLVLWFDATPILVKPNRAQDAKDAHREVSISDAALRRELDFSEDDAPDEEELQRRVGMRRGFITAELTRQLLEEGGIGVDEPEGPEDGGAGPGTEPGSEGEPDADDRRGAPPPPDEGPGASVVAAADRRRLDQLAETLADIDRNLLERVLFASDAALSDALARAGARARSAASRNTEAKALVSGVPASEVTRTLGRSMVSALGLSEERLLEEAFADLEGRYDQMVERSQRAALDAVEAEAPAGLPDRTAAEQAQDDDRREGWLLLLALLTGTARERLFSPAPAPPPVGEFDDTTALPPGTVRKSLQRAGGARSFEEAAGTLLVDAGRRPAGGVATGEQIRELVGDALRATFGGWRWVYGDPSLRQTPFEPHRALNGVEFPTWDASVLVNTQAWPPVSHFHPGDHPHCKCSFVPAIEARIAEAA